MLVKEHKISDFIINSIYEYEAVAIKLENMAKEEGINSLTRLALDNIEAYCYSVDLERLIAKIEMVYYMFDIPITVLCDCSKQYNKLVEGRVLRGNKLFYNYNLLLNLKQYFMDNWLLDW